MREVQIVESLKYGARAFLYFIASVILGGGGIALGFAVGYNAVTIFGTGGDPVIYDTPELIAGVVLVILGGTVLFTGLFGLGYKLLADSVTAGYENTSAPEVSRESSTSTVPEPTTEHSETATDKQPGGRHQTVQARRATGTAGKTRANASDEPDPQQPSASGGEREGNGDPGEEPEQVHDTGASEHQRTAPPMEDDSQEETAGERQATPPTEPAQEPEASASPTGVEEDADQWGPPGHTDEGEAPSAESTASDTDKTRESEPGDEQDKEQTAGEIAFGRAETADEQSTTSTERAPSPESETDAELSARSEAQNGDDTFDGEETDAESRAHPEDPPEEEPAPSQQDGEPEEHRTDEGAGGDESEEPLVPEYDEIPNEDGSTDTDSENGDPLGDPVDEES